LKTKFEKQIIDLLNSPNQKALTARAVALKIGCKRQNATHALLLLALQGKITASSTDKSMYFLKGKSEIRIKSGTDIVYCGNCARPIRDDVEIGWMIKADDYTRIWCSRPDCVTAGAAWGQKYEEQKQNQKGQESQ